MNFIRQMDRLQDGEKALLEKRSHLRLKVLSWLENQLPTIKPRLGLKDICNDNVMYLNFFVKNYLQKQRAKCYLFLIL